MDLLLRDLRYTLRVFRRNPAFVGIAVLSLAIGIGPNTVLFSVIDAVGFRPLPIRDPAGLVSVRSGRVTRPDTDSPETEGVAFRDYVEIRNRVGSFAEVGAAGRSGFGLGDGAHASEVVMGAVVTASYFRALGVRPLLGRTFLPEEDRMAGTHEVIVIGERLWRRRFVSDPAVIGRSVRLNSTPCTVVGVLPAEFTGTDFIVAPEVWVPATLWPHLAGGPSATLEAVDRRDFNVVARLRDGVAIEQAQAEVAALGASLAAREPGSHQDWRLVAEYEQAARRRRLRPIGAFSLVAMDLILLVACANVAGLLLGRADARRSELAVRIALGASRWRIVRQLLTESVVLAVAGALLGSLLAMWFLKLALLLVPAMPIRLSLDFRLDLRVLAGTLAAGLVAAPVFGLIPALVASRPDLVPMLKGGDTRRGRLTPRNLLVVGQVAVSLTLLISSALFTRSFLSQRQLDPGFVPRPMVFSTMAPGAAGYDSLRTREFYRRLLERLSATPGVERATMVRHFPLNALFGGGNTAEVVIPRFEPPAGAEPLRFPFNIVGTDYFDTMGIRLVNGRDFLSADRAGAPAVVLVNQTMARRFWRDEDPVGRHLTVVVATADGPSRRDCEIVGVVRDGRYMSLSEPPVPYLYLPYGQVPRGEMTVVARVSTDPRAMMGVLRRVVAELDPAVPMMQVTTLEEHMQTALAGPRAVAVLVGVLGGLGLVLSIVGLYGVVAFLVSRRTREFGVRIALGASGASVIRAVVLNGGTLALIGIAVGLGLTAVVVSMLGENVVYAVNRFDPLTYLTTSVLVLLTALLGSYAPARRAARINPVEALRSE